MRFVFAKYLTDDSSTQAKGTSGISCLLADSPVFCFGLFFIQSPREIVVSILRRSQVISFLEVALEVRGVVIPNIESDGFDGLKMFFQVVVVLFPFALF